MKIALEHRIRANQTFVTVDRIQNALKKPLINVQRDYANAVRMIIAHKEKLAGLEIA